VILVHAPDCGGHFARRLLIAEEVSCDPEIPEKELVCQR
jgi:hypothetical protein